MLLLIDWTVETIIMCVYYRESLDVKRRFNALEQIRRTQRSRAQRDLGRGKRIPFTH